MRIVRVYVVYSKGRRKVLIFQIKINSKVSKERRKTSFCFKPRKYIWEWIVRSRDKKIYSSAAVCFSFFNFSLALDSASVPHATVFTWSYYSAIILLHSFFCSVALDNLSDLLYRSSWFSQLFFAVQQWIQLLFMFLQLFLIYFFCPAMASGSSLFLLLFLIFFCCPAMVSAFLCFCSCFSSNFCCPAMASASVSVSEAVSHLFFAVIQWLQLLFLLLQLFIIYFCCPTIASASVSVSFCSCFSSIFCPAMASASILFLHCFATVFCCSCNRFRFCFCHCSCFSSIFCCPAMSSATFCICFCRCF